MAFPFPVSEVLEGRARLLIPAVPRRRGPGSRGPWPFYNPTMVVNRDLSAVALEKWPGPLREALDGLAATGAWGIRMALEASIPRVVFSDRSPVAVPVLRANVERNHVTGEVLAEDLASVLGSRSFDFVDLDPFGSPVPFLGPALESARVGSGVGLTATDTAPLSGTYPDTCLRRYGARSERCPQGHEIGLRILLGYCERVAAARGKSIQPLLAYSTEHFLRILLRVVPLDEARPSIVAHVFRAADGAFVRAETADSRSLGPLWLGPLGNAAFVRRLAPTDWTRPATSRLLDSLRQEVGMPAFFVTTDQLAARLRRAPPKMDRFLQALRDAGFSASRTHFDPRGVKADAPLVEIERVFRSLTSTEPTGGSGPAS